jgi:hypothetical protein
MPGGIAKDVEPGASSISTGTTSTGTTGITSMAGDALLMPAESASLAVAILMVSAAPQNKEVLSRSLDRRRKVATYG